jgi:hypothetical protein
MTNDLFEQSISEVILESLGGRRVYLSPHYDDICFSLGSFVETHPGGTIINLFTRGDHLAGRPFNGVPEEEEIARVQRLRRLEDEAFARSRDLTQIDLGLDEPMVRGRRSRDHSGLNEDMAQLAAPLLRVLGDLADEAPEIARPILFCPAAIGGHTNHLATLKVVLENFNEIEASYRVLFYEDLPYAAVPTDRVRDLARLTNILSDRRPRRWVWQLAHPSAQRKLDSIGLYASQFSSPEIDVESRFSPAASMPSCIHEAVWDFSRV